MTYRQLAAQVARRSLQRQWQSEISVWVLLAFTVLALFVSVATASPSPINTQSPAVLQKGVLDCTEHEVIPFYTAEQQANTLAFLAEFPYTIPTLSNTWVCHNFCKWNGVHCSEEGVEVSLDSRRLIGRLPEVPAAVDPDHIMVTSIIFKGRGDGIESTLPESWFHLTKLTTLHLNLESKPSVSKSMRIQNVAYNMQPMNTVASSPKTTACFLPYNVVNVSLTHNSISGHLPPGFPLCNPKIKYLYLQYNPDINGPIPKEWGKWTSLQILNIKGTRVCGCAPPEWANFNTPVTLLAEDQVTHPEICKTSCPDIHTSSSASSSSSSSAPSSSSSGSLTTTEAPTPDPVLPSSGSSSGDRTFYDALHFYCPNVEETGVEAIQAHKAEICCNAWDGAAYSVTCGDEIRGFSHGIVTCSGAIGSRGYFSCCSRVARDGTATYLGERCEDKPVDGVDKHKALVTWWNPRTSGGGLLVTLLAVIVVLVL